MGFYRVLAHILGFLSGMLSGLVCYRCWVFGFLWVSAFVSCIIVCLGVWFCSFGVVWVVGPFAEHTRLTINLVL